MPTIQLSDEQVFELVKQLPFEQKMELLRYLRSVWEEAWLELANYGQERAREVARQRGLDWDSMTEDEREAFIDQLLHEKP